MALRNFKYNLCMFLDSFELSIENKEKKFRENWFVNGVSNF